ncbi:tetratricopeptide repeat protein [Flavisolibacter ginsenosidimutans]|uniref:Tetratricopeptide repeat protein n=1 Tax=Flavisolibacter ginsenosidimutans TaxID=661481 RepID=A0A5B8UN16_9BACT|nr:tetratricopeptide repeat protein [Flavisolibacter ginsenosidimutans]QEC57470.1 tetratricopeptide repeat protein [Flavisolibacter ginsenosidimutans]
MKKISLSMFIMFFCLLFTASVSAQVKQAAAKETGKKTMAWTTKSEAAKELAGNGIGHFMNIEMEQAYQDLSAALKLDPDFTVALVFMANLTAGESKKAFAERAFKSAGDKSEGEKLLASIVDPANKGEKNRATWAKLHEMFPDGGMIGHFYVVSRATPEEQFAAAQDYIKKFPQNASMYNIIAYYYMQNKKDYEMAKKNFEKYIELNPDGPNAYDSMAEFYLTTGDVTNAEKYYTMALEKYPFFNSSINALQKIADDKKKKDKASN